MRLANPRSGSHSAWREPSGSTGIGDRELCLHLLFLAWYCNLEPPYLTGFNQTSFPSDELSRLFHNVYESLEPEIHNDAECLYVVGLMALLTPYLLGDDTATWETRSCLFERRFRSLAPSGLPAAHFEGRGAYGNYFAGQTAVPGGYGCPTGVEPDDLRPSLRSQDRSKTLDELEGVVWGPPTFDSSLVVTCHRLRTLPLSDFTAENLRIMLGQHISVPLLLPLAVEFLRGDPFTAGDFYPGDLLTVTLQAADAGSYEKAHLVEIARAALSELSVREQDDYPGPFEPIHAILAGQLRSSLARFLAEQGALI